MTGAPTTARQSVYRVSLVDERSRAVTLKGLAVTPETPVRKSIVKTTFEDANNYMKDGVLLRQVLNVIDELMETLRMIQPRLYNAVVAKLAEIG